VHPLVVEAVEQLAEGEAGMAFGEQDEAVGRRVALPREKREIVTKDVERDALDVPRGTLGRQLPLLGRKAAEQSKQLGTLRPERGRQIERGRQFPLSSCRTELSP